ncbi:MAG: YdiU family protein [Rhodobacteraceae bacterium]|nr:YdiU family protein [Paracoccaceae bacterium]
MFSFDNTYAKLPNRFYARVQPRTPSNPKPVIRNVELARELELDIDAFLDDAGVAALSGLRVPEGAAPLAMAYAGHQFGVWVPSLGDGRALLLGEIIDRHGRRRDIHLKGSGKTPFSRQGDGKMWLGPAIREYIVSEALHGLGIPTTRSLAVMETGDPVYRERAFPGAVLTRVGNAHVRVGTFEYFAARNDDAAVKLLADYVISRLYPELIESDRPYIELLRTLIKRQAELIAQWMSVGFIHGVMNTDNVSLAVETIDFGPCAFMDIYSPGRVFSSIDSTGRYSFSLQPSIAHLNLLPLARSLLPFIDDDRKRAIQLAQDALDAFPDTYDLAYEDIAHKKLGLYEWKAGDKDLASDFLGAVRFANADLTLSYRTISTDQPLSLKCEDFAAFCEDLGPFEDWLYDWHRRLRSEKVCSRERGEMMRRHNPLYIARNHQVQKAIDKALDGDFSYVHWLAKVLSQPFTEQDGAESLAQMPLKHEVVHETYCGT